MKNKEIDDGSNQNRFTAVIQRDDIKSLFRFLVGTSDSEEMILARLIRIRKEDILRLFEKLNDKLTNHNVESTVITIDITFANGKVKHFGTW